MSLVFETERLVVRMWSPEDAEAAFTIYGDPEVMRYVGDGRPIDSVATMRERIERIRERVLSTPKRGHWALCLKDGPLVGGGILLPLPDGSDHEVGYHLAKHAWGNGYATEYTRAALRYGRDAWGLERIVGVTYPENVPSQRVLLKAGLEHRGTYEYHEIHTELFVIEGEALKRL